MGRIHGHSTSDAQELYRSRDDIERTRESDPVTAYADRLTVEGVVDAAWRESVDAEVRDLRNQLMKAYAR